MVLNNQPTYHVIMFCKQVASKLNGIKPKHIVNLQVSSENIDEPTQGAGTGDATQGGGEGDTTQGDETGNDPTQGAGTGDATQGGGEGDTVQGDGGDVTQGSVRWRRRRLTVEAVKVEFDIEASSVEMNDGAENSQSGADIFVSIAPLLPPALTSSAPTKMAQHRHLLLPTAHRSLALAMLFHSTPSQAIWRPQCRRGVCMPPLPQRRAWQAPLLPHQHSQYQS